MKETCNIFDNHCDLYINIDFFPLPFQYFDVDMDFIKNLNLLNLSPIFYSDFFCITSFILFRCISISTNLQNLIKRNTVFCKKKLFQRGNAHSTEIKHIMCHTQLCHLVGEI